MFWADETSVQDYKLFGEAITFNTTYVTSQKFFGGVSAKDQGGLRIKNLV